MELPNDFRAAIDGLREGLIRTAPPVEPTGPTADADGVLLGLPASSTGMAEFTNPYAEESPFVSAHFDCLECGGKLWEYAIQGSMVCEDCRSVFRSAEVFEAQV